METIKSLTVILETVTPMFLGGANPRGEPELRAPSFRGALRYWLRAALGGVYGDDTAGLDAIKKAEAQVFGGTKTERSTEIERSTETKRGVASAVVLRVNGDLKPVEYQRERAVRVRKYGREILQPTGRDYLYWSMSGFRGEPNRRYYPEGSRFLLKLTVRPGASNGLLALQEAIAALWLLAHLGGVGSRSRRTGGSLSVVEPTRVDVDDLDLSFVLGSTDLKGIAQELQQGLNAVRNLFQQHHQRDKVKAPSVPSAFDVLHPRVCKVWVLGMWPSSAEAVEAIGRAMRDFRTYREPDHSEVAKWLRGKSIKTVERSVFGLPLPFRYSDNGPRGVVQGRTEPLEQAIDRRASPLWLTISKTKQGSYVGIATLFNSQFLPLGERLYEHDGKGPALVPPADYGLIQRFIAESFDAVEVSFGSSAE